MREIYDVIVIGTGISGLSAAIFLKEAGFKVIVITKEDKIEDTTTNLAQGGIIAWKEGDTPESLASDILNAGYNYNNKKAVEVFSESGPKLVFDFLINKLKIDFTKTKSGDLNYTEEAAHSDRRILHYEDHTGDKIQSALISYAKKIHIPILTSHTSIDLITNNHHSRDYQELYKTREVMGIYALDNHNDIVKTMLAHNVILATGGLGNIYEHTTNHPSATGDGLSMGYRAGADIINAEFVQFHPTSLFHKDIKRFLISEAVRGEGAKLIDHKGNKFMEKHTPLKELAARDVVARAIFDEMRKQGVKYMLLDIANFYKGEIPLLERFSKIYNTCLQGGIDITKQPIPIVPAAHYFCGGIKVNLAGRTSIKNLYAVGEVSCTGLHGANRLASSSLLEGLLWAKFSANDIISNRSEINKQRFNNIPDWFIPEHTESFDPILLNQDWQAIRLTMWNYAGIIRTKKGLERAGADINYYAHRIFKFYKEAVLTRQIIELRNSIVNAFIIVNSAIHNTKSVGCHFIKE